MGMVLEEMLRKNITTPGCHEMPGLSAGQGRLCHLYNDHMFAVAVGAQQAIQECKYQFQQRRWNCSTVSDDNNSVFGPIYKLGKSPLTLKYYI